MFEQAIVEAENGGQDLNVELVHKELGLLHVYLGHFDLVTVLFGEFLCLFQIEIITICLGLFRDSKTSAFSFT